MKFIDQARDLDTKDIGRWPVLFQALLIAVVFVLVAGGGTYYFVVKNKIPELERVRLEEADKKKTFEDRQLKAANIGGYKLQLEEMQRSFGAMLRQLPGKTEVPSLLVDISQTGLAAGLEEELFQPSQEVQRDFYAELPIKIRLTGDYHELGAFVSGIAALPRIVTLHDISVTPETDAQSSPLVLDVTAKTYRYIEDEENAQ